MFIAEKKIKTKKALRFLGLKIAYLMIQMGDVEAIKEAEKEGVVIPDFSDGDIKKAVEGLNIIRNEMLEINMDFELDLAERHDETREFEEVLFDVEQKLGRQLQPENISAKRWYIMIDKINKHG